MVVQCRNGAISIDEIVADVSSTAQGTVLTLYLNPNPNPNPNPNTNPNPNPNPNPNLQP